ncbi:MAG: hypothetical protein LQ349_005682 [Xanthoria aureola]|nr:MAG: hypothetical protein LQ349_005682 [Xanthoria aureola]
MPPEASKAKATPANTTRSGRVIKKSSGANLTPSNPASRSTSRSKAPPRPAAQRTPAQQNDATLEDEPIHHGSGGEDQNMNEESNEEPDEELLALQRRAKQTKKAFERKKSALEVEESIRQSNLALQGLSKPSGTSGSHSPSVRQSSYQPAFLTDEEQHHQPESVQSLIDVSRADSVKHIYPRARKKYILEILQNRLRVQTIRKFDDSYSTVHPMRWLRKPRA